jgi:hypothetical protein
LLVGNVPIKSSLAWLMQSNVDINKIRVGVKRSCPLCCYRWFCLHCHQHWHCDNNCRLGLSAALIVPLDPYLTLWSMVGADKSSSIQACIGRHDPHEHYKLSQLRLLPVLHMLCSLRAVCAG